LNPFLTFRRDWDGHFPDQDKKAVFDPLATVERRLLMKKRMLRRNGVKGGGKKEWAKDFRALGGWRVMTTTQRLYGFTSVCGLGPDKLPSATRGLSRCPGSPAAD